MQGGYTMAYPKRRKAITTDNVLELLAKAEKYDILKPLLDDMFNATTTKQFFEAQRAIKNELKFLP